MLAYLIGRAARDTEALEREIAMLSERFGEAAAEARTNGKALREKEALLDAVTAQVRCTVECIPFFPLGSWNSYESRYFFSEFYSILAFSVLFGIRKSEFNSVVTFGTSCSISFQSHKNTWREKKRVLLDAVAAQA